ncbi:MAG: VOC family protein [Promethearchaeota archaeon]
MGVVYKDFSKIQEKIKEMYGMSEINVVDSNVEINTFIKELEKPLKIRVGFANIGNTMIELFQPLDDNSIYSEYLEKYPEGGVHHVGFLVTDIEKEAKKWDEMGIKRMISGILPTNQFVYYDTREVFGYVTEIMDNVPPPREMLEEIYDRIRKKE